LGSELDYGSDEEEVSGDRSSDIRNQECDQRTAIGGPEAWRVDTDQFKVRLELKGGSGGMKKGVLEMRTPFF
jgi:hypothetical protein